MQGLFHNRGSLILMLDISRSLNWFFRARLFPTVDGVVHVRIHSQSQPLRIHQLQVLSDWLFRSHSVQKPRNYIEIHFDIQTHGV
jgi:hypothetical protein